MATGVSWRLTGFGRLVYGRGEKEKAAWTMFDSKCNKPAINITILESGYLLVVQGQKTLETIPLLGCTNSLKMKQQSENLLLRVIVKGESYVMGMKFDGSSMAEAINGCSDAVKKLKEFLPVTTHPLHPNQPPAEPPTPTTQVLRSHQGAATLSPLDGAIYNNVILPADATVSACQEEAVGAEPEVVPEPLSIKLLTQHYLGETAVALPREYHHSPLAQGDLESFLRVCLLDPGFNAFVEKVEVELRKLREE